jgi:hypothetical protein
VAKLVKRLGNIRMAGTSLTIDTGDWQDGQHEQVSFGLQADAGVMMFEIAKLTRQAPACPTLRQTRTRVWAEHGYDEANPPPSALIRELLREQTIREWRPGYQKSKHKPASYRQSTGTFLYHLDNQSHVDALFDLLDLASAVGATLDGRQSTHNLGMLASLVHPGKHDPGPLGRRVELNRRAFGGLRRLTEHGTLEAPPQGSQGYEVVSVVCKQAIRTTLPPEYRRLRRGLDSGLIPLERHAEAEARMQRLLEHDWAMAQDAKNLEYYLEVSRVLVVPTGGRSVYQREDGTEQYGPADLTEIPGHYLEEVGVLSLPVQALVGLRRQFSGWWDRAYREVATIWLDEAMDIPRYRLAPINDYAKRILRPDLIDYVMQHGPQPYLLARPGRLTESVTRYCTEVTGRPTGLEQYTDQYLGRLAAFAHGEYAWDHRLPCSIEAARRDANHVASLVAAMPSSARAVKTIGTLLCLRVVLAKARTVQYRATGFPQCLTQVAPHRWLCLPAAARGPPN